MDSVNLARAMVYYTRVSKKMVSPMGMDTRKLAVGSPIQATFLKANAMELELKKSKMNLLYLCCGRMVLRLCSSIMRQKIKSMPACSSFRVSSKRLAVLPELTQVQLSKSHQTSKNASTAF